MNKLTTFYNRYHKQNRNKFYTKLIQENNFTYYYVLEFLRDRYRGKRLGKVIDIGCGVGTLSLFFAKYSTFVLGLDVASDAIEIAEQAKKANNVPNVKFINSEVRAKLGSFDLALCTEVIEHVPDEAAFLQTISHLLTPDGVLFLSTPSSDNFLTKVGYFAGFDARVGHLRRYTEESLTALLHQHGFRVIKIRSVEGLPRMLLFTTRLGLLIKLIRGPLIPAFHWIDAVNTYLFGAHDIQVIAVKK